MIEHPEQPANRKLIAENMLLNELSDAITALAKASRLDGPVAARAQENLNSAGIIVIEQVKALAKEPGSVGDRARAILIRLRVELSKDE